ncbi:hypothetical protein [Thiocapsa sp.]|uniref:hypothetical protein n=1 Tax=Thiocapsa sp. TaxID=2024551 RepID=UPI003593B2CF
MTRYIIRADEPFRGHVQSVLNPDGTVGYTKGQTLEQYAAELGAPLRTIDGAELDGLVAAFEAGQITEPAEITEDAFHEALNVLPPSRWGHCMGVELFHICKHLTGDLVNWYAHLDGRYWAFVDLCTAPGEDLAGKVARASEPSAARE